MLKNYFITAINNLLKNKLYSAINIVGLAVGLAACILITLHVQDELSYDKQWEKADLIYRVNEGDSPDDLDFETESEVLPALKKYFPEEIEFGTRIGWREDYEEIEIDNMHYHEKVYFVDKEYIKIFQVEELKGRLESTMQSPGNIALSEESATKYFGDKDPIGEIITLIIDSVKEQYKVTAVYRFISPNTVLNLSALTLRNEGFSGDCETYVRFSDTASIEKFVNRIPDFVDKGIPDNKERGVFTFGSGRKKSYSIQKLSDIYFNPVITENNPPPAKIGNKTVITVFIIISVLVLIIGCINFIILTTANATQRAREVAMRKVVGARFKQLIFQFLGESILVTFIAFLLSVGIVKLALPYFELLMNKELTVPYSSPGSYVSVLLLLILVGLLGGLYPGLVLSRFSPTRALKANQTTEAGGSIWLRNILVIFQFAVSIILIVAALVAYFQLLYTSKHDPGFNPENLLVVHVNGPGLWPYKKTLHQELLKLPEVTNVGLSNEQPQLVGGNYSAMPFRRKNDTSAPNQENSYRNMYVNYDFFNTYEISLLSGRYFTQGMDQEEPGWSLSSNTGGIKNRRIIINLAAARQLGYASAEEAVGGAVEAFGFGANIEYSIIGIVEDSQYRSIRIKPKPETYHLTSDSAQFLTVRYQGDYQTVVKEVELVWKSVVGDVPIRVGNVKQNLAAIFDQEEKENNVLIAFTLLSVFIACMGLFGMAAFTVERRVKEIGLRKVMGAKVKDIVNLLGWNFLKPVLIATLIAWPIAIFAMQSWLELFPYRFNPLFMIPICLVSGLIALAIAWFTVAGNTKRVAKNNPIKALRYE